MNNFFRYAVIAFILGVAQPSFAASALTVSSSGNGVFTLQGAGMEGAAAIEVTLSYDASTLANPKVAQGLLISGAMMAANPNTPGIVRVAVIRTTPISGSGPILTFTFDRKTVSPGRITGLNVRLSDINGKPLYASAQIINPSDTSSSSGDASTQQKESGPDASQSTGQSNIPANVPADVPTTIIIAGPVQKTDEASQPKQGEPAVAAQPEPEVVKERVTSMLEPPMQKGNAGQSEKSSKEKAVYTQKSILDLFKDFKTAKSPKALLALFEQEPMIGFRQEPSVAMSDGKSTAKVTFVSLTKAGDKPEVSLKGAGLTSLRKDDNNTNTWIAEVRPEKGIAAASLVVPQQNLTMIFPLTVAPKADPDMDKSGKVTEEDFTRFLKGPKGKKLKGFDLNADGAVNYIDEYIYTANYIAAYIAAQAKAGGKKAKGN